MRPLPVVVLLAALTRTALAGVPAGALPQALPVAPAGAAGPRAPAWDAAVSASALGLVLELRSDFGFERLLELAYTNGRRATIHVNDGHALAAGWSFLPLAGGRLATRVSGGVKLQALRASNGILLFTAIPLELMEVAYVGPFRLGAGASVLLAPRLRGTGSFQEMGVRFRAAPGAVIDAEWIVAARTRTGVGVRAAWFRLTGPDGSRSGASVGLVLRADFDLTGRGR